MTNEINNSRFFDRPDPRSTAELIECALIDEARDDDDPDRNGDIDKLMARANREVLEASLELCSSKESDRRVLGARILGQLGRPARAFPEECCDALLQLVKDDPDIEVIITAVFALGHLGNHRCDTHLLSLSDHPNEEVRHGVAFAFIGTENLEAIKVLLKLMEDTCPEVRDWATFGIGEVSLDNEEIRLSLLRRVEDSDECTRAEALCGLSRRHDRRVLPYLIKEVQIEREKLYLFEDAASLYLNIKENIGATALLPLLISENSKKD